jgi:cell wall-active antibiotic response 4TMS protein YvqF
MDFDNPVNPGQVAGGAVVMVLGLLFLMDKTDIVPYAILGLFWPGLLVTWGFSRIVWPSRPGREVGGLWIALAGGLLMLDQLSVVRIAESWPLIVVMAGLMMIFRALDWLPSRVERRDFFDPRDGSRNSALANGSRR